MDYSQLQFGKPAAERDLQHLKNYFVESGTYSRVANGSKRFLLGNRGAGKSAIFKIIAAREKAASNVVIELSPEDYSYQMLADIVAGEADGNWVKSGAYAAAWKYLILILAMKKLAKLPRHKERWGKDEKRMFRYLSNNHANVAEHPLDILISYLRRLEGLKLGPYEAGIRSRELIRLYKIEELEPFIPVVVDMCRRTQVSIFVDELDKGWDASEDAKAFVAGLFQACTTLNDLSPKFRVFVSLRQELYDNIPALYDDTQKYRDLFETISWGSDDLWTMLCQRIRHYVPGLKTASDDLAWSAVFEGKETFEYMLERTLYRPRELILYASEALELTRSAKRSMPISHDTVQAVEPAFSSERSRDLVAEYRWQYPQLDTIFSTFHGTRTVWKREALLEHLLDVSVGSAVQPLDRPDWVDGIDPERLLDVLWRVGFLTVVGGGGQHRGVRPGSPEDPLVDIRRAEQLEIAPLFHRGLGFE